MLAFLLSLVVLTADDGAAQPAAAPADAAAPAAQPAAKTPSADPLDKVVCKKEHVAGSKRPQKICMTAREWSEGGAETGKVKKQ